MSAEAARGFDLSSEFSGIIHYLRSRLGTLVLWSAGFAAIAVAYLLLVSPSYIAATEIFLDPRGLQVVANDVTPRSDTNEFAVSLVESQMRIAQSEAVLRTVVDRLGLDKDPEFARPPGFLSKVRNAIAPQVVEDDATRAMRSLDRGVTVRRASRSYVVVISARSEDPVKAARIANTLASVYIEHEVGARQGSADRVENAMSSRLNELAERVRLSEDAVETFKAQNDLVGSAAHLISDQQLESLNARVSAAHANVVQQRARVEQIDALLAAGGEPGALLEAVQSPTIASLRSQYAQMARRQSAAETLLGPHHPDLKAIREQRAGYRRLINEELARIAEATRSEYRRALSSEQALSADFDRMKGTTIRSNKAMVRLRELSRQSNSNKDIYQAFLVRAKEIGAQGRVDTSNTRVIASAIAPNQPSGPRAILLLVAIIGGFALSAGYLWFFGARSPGSNSA